MLFRGSRRSATNIQKLSQRSSKCWWIWLLD
jgi:hypothetical protein